MKSRVIKIAEMAAYLSVVLACLGSAACSDKIARATEAERSRDLDRLEPNIAQSNYVKIETVNETDAAPAIRVTGKLGLDEDHTQRVATPIDGRASRILVELGDQVRSGQILLELTSTHVSETQADAQKAQQDLDVATKAFGRANKLKLDGAVSEKEAAQAEADFRKAKSDAARTVAQLTSLGVSPMNPTTSVAIRAQMGGTIVERNVSVGQEVRADSTQALFTISDLKTVWVIADVHEQNIELVHKGDAVKIRVPAYPEDSFDGKVDYVGDVLDPMSRTVKIRCPVLNKNFKLKPEMFVNLELSELHGQKVITLPSSAILTDSEHTRVLVVSSDHAYQPRIITVGEDVDDRVRVLRGLNVGEQVVTEGAIFLRRNVETHN